MTNARNSLRAVYLVGLLSLALAAPQQRIKKVRPRHATSQLRGPAAAAVAPLSRL